MTTDLEKQFFDTFGIKEKYVSHYDELYPDYKHYTMEYPQITNRHYLELIILVNSPYYEIEYVYTDVQDLKVSILEQAIKCYKNDKLFTKHIQALFKEER